MAVLEDQGLGTTSHFFGNHKRLTVFRCRASQANKLLNEIAAETASSLTCTLTPDPCFPSGSNEHRVLGAVADVDGLSLDPTPPAIVDS